MFTVNIKDMSPKPNSLSSMVKFSKIIIKEVKGKRALPANELKEFQKLVETFQTEIVQKWIDYFVLHKQINCIKIEGKVK